MQTEPSDRVTAATRAELAPATPRPAVAQAAHQAPAKPGSGVATSSPPGGLGEPAAEVSAASATAAADALAVSARLLGEAEDARQLVESDPRLARQRAIDIGRTANNVELRSVALRVEALAASRLGRNREAIKRLTRAIGIAETTGLAARAAEARLSLVVVHAADGNFAAALDEAERARDGLSRDQRAELDVHRGLVLARLGRSAEALPCFDAALRVLDESASPTAVARARLNRGVMLTYAGRFRDAERDFHRCLALSVSHGLTAGTARASQNLGYVAALRGDVPIALEWLDKAVNTYRSGGMNTSTALLDRAEALLAVGLAAEARAAGATAVDELTGQRRAADLAEAHLTFARAGLAANDPAAARAAARAARRAFVRQGRNGWAALAEHLELRSRWELHERSERLAADAGACADRLATTGWREASLQCRVLGARAYLRRGDTAAAAVQLERAAAARHRGPVDQRTAAWHAEALLRQARGDDRGALRALRAGLDTVDSYAAVLGATDLRAHAATHGRPLAELGLRLVLGRGSARETLRWLERVRTTALRHAPARPPRDTGLASDLADLRRVATQVTSARGTGEVITALQREQLRLERAVRDRARHARGLGQTSTRLDPSTLAGALGRRVLIEYFVVDAQLHAIVVRDGRCRLVPLVGYADVLREADSLRFSMHRLARRHGSPGSLAAADVVLRHAATTLGDLLIAPLGTAVSGRELVVVPTMALHSLPWTALPALVGSPVSVAPSASAWLRARSQPRRRVGRTVLVAGPDLQHAAPELRALRRTYPEATVLTGRAATAERTRSAMDGARLAHLACHGHFRADNPQFSSLRLADGPLMVYDLERLRRAPEVIVLSACDAGLSAVHAGDELMGLSSALFALGTRTLVASVTPVNDESARHLMIDFHRRLSAGTSPASALAESQASLGVLGFACFGAG